MPVIPYNPEKSSVQVVKTSSYTKDKISSMIVIILIKFPTIRKGGGPKITRIGECSYRNCPTHTHTHSLQWPSTFLGMGNQNEIRFHVQSYTSCAPGPHAA